MPAPSTAGRFGEVRAIGSANTVAKNATGAAHASAAPSQGDVAPARAIMTSATTRPVTDALM